MFRFSIRDVPWLMMVVGLACALWIQIHRFKATSRDLQKAQAELNIYHAEQAIAALRAKELKGGVILTPAPTKAFPALDRYEELQRPKDE